MLSRRWETALLCGLILSVLLSMSGMEFLRRCGEVRDGTLRLHVVANSDSAEDQAVKLLVRDAVTEVFAREMGQAHSRAEAAELAEELLPQAIDAAQAVLQENGFSYECAARILTADFPTVDYGSFTMPAGSYEAVRIELGAAAGKNWWCVLYPCLCLDAAVSPADAYGANGELLENPDYKIGFRVVELWEAAKNLFR